MKPRPASSWPRPRKPLPRRPAARGQRDRSQHACGCSSYDAPAGAASRSGDQHSLRRWWALSGQPGCVPRDAPCVKWSAPHFGQCRNASICWFCAEIASTCLFRSVESVVSQVVDVTHKSENMRNDLVRRRLAHLGTCHVYPHSAHVLVYACGCHGNRMRRSSPRDGDQSSASPTKRPVSRARPAGVSARGSRARSRRSFTPAPVPSVCCQQAGSPRPQRGPGAVTWVGLSGLEPPASCLAVSAAEAAR